MAVLLNVHLPVRNKWLRHTWLIILLILISTFSGHLPEDVLFPFGRAYMRFANLFTGFWHDTFVSAAERFLYPGYAYYLAQPVCWMLVAIYCFLASDKYARPVCIFFIGAATNQLLDELIFNPYKFSWNEVVTGLLFIFFAWQEYRRVKTAKA